MLRRRARETDIACFPARAGTRAKVLFEYNPENDDELELAVGAIINDIKVAEEGWLEGTLGGRRGLFPDNFVEILADAAPPSEPAVGKRNDLKALLPC